MKNLSFWPSLKECLIDLFVQETRRLAWQPPVYYVGTQGVTRAVRFLRNGIAYEHEQKQLPTLKPVIQMV